MKERHAQGIRDGQHHMTIGYPFVERPANMAHPLVDVHLTARQTKAALAAKRHPFLFQAVEFIPLSFWYDAPLTSRYSDRRHGFDQGVGHPLLLLYDAKASLGKNSSYF